MYDSQTWWSALTRCTPRKKSKNIFLMLRTKWLKNCMGLMLPDCKNQFGIFEKPNLGTLGFCNRNTCRSIKLRTKSTWQTSMLKLLQFTTYFTVTWKQLDVEQGGDSRFVIKLSYSFSLSLENITRKLSDLGTEWNLYWRKRRQ